jgi:dTDP-glucose pyrophosphorylase
MNSEYPKVLMPISGKPVLGHVVEFWQNQGISNFVFVVGYRRELVIDYLGSLALKSYHIVVQPELKGIAHAILQTQKIVSGRFVVVLGDCLNVGRYEYPDSMELGYAIWDNTYKNAQFRGCSVITIKDEISALQEKPPMDYAGIGTYFFDTRIFEYIRNTKPSQLRNEYEITDVMSNMIKDGQHIKAVRFIGDFINFTYQSDIEYADKLLKMKVKV